MVRVTVSGRTVQLRASTNDTYDWAHRVGSSWPSSQLSDHRLFAEFVQGDLVDIRVDGKDADLDVSEFNAFASDMLKDRLDPSHPDYDVLVTRFQDAGFQKPSKVTYSATRKPKSKSKKSTTVGVGRIR